MTIHEEYFEYVDPDENHFKFWSYSYNDATRVLQVTWGRIGTRGQSKTFNGQSSVAVHERVAEKIRKGYTRAGGSGSKAPLRSPTPPPTPDHEENISARMRARVLSTTGSPYGYTIVQCYEYTHHGAFAFRDCVEVACITNDNMVKLAKDFGIWFSMDELKEAEHVAYLLNHPKGIDPKDGQRYAYPGSFSTLHIDGSGLATG